MPEPDPPIAPERAELLRALHNHVLAYGGMHLLLAQADTEDELHEQFVDDIARTMSDIIRLGSQLMALTEIAMIAQMTKGETR